MKTVKIRPALIGATTGLFLLLMSMVSPSFAQTEWNVGISGGSGGIDGFIFSMGQYYGVPERDIVVIRERGIYEEELPVVFFIARMAGVDPGLVADLRMRGMSWMDITYYFGLRPDVYYVPVVVHRYVPAYGYYNSHPRGTWKRRPAGSGHREPGEPEVHVGASPVCTGKDHEVPQRGAELPGHRP